jgi:hypothetical protein
MAIMRLQVTACSGEETPIKSQNDNLSQLPSTSVSVNTAAGAPGAGTHLRLLPKISR